MTRNGVTDDQYGKLWHRLGEVARRVKEGTLGYTKTMSVLQGVVEGVVQVVSFKRDMTKEGCALLEDVPFDGKSFTPDIVGFLKSGESYVKGDVMRSRAKELNTNLGQRHAEYLLNHQELISKEWRGKYYLVFPGTVWQHRIGSCRVPYLSWDGDQWFLSFLWLGSDWGSDVRLVSSRK